MLRARPHSPAWIAAAAFAAAWLTAWAGHADEPARVELLAGVTRIGAPGVPGPLCVCGERAFPVVVGGAARRREPVVAGVHAGAGRAVAFGHDGYFSAGTLEVAETGRLLVNAVRWAGAGSRGGRNGPVVGVLGAPGLLDHLRAEGLEAEAADGADWRARLPEFGVFCCSPSRLSETDLPAVAAYLAAGGGLVLADLGWGWLQLNPGKTIQDHPGNQLLAFWGVIWADGTVQRTTALGYAAGEPPPALCHAGRAIAALVAHPDGEPPGTPEAIAQASWTAGRAVRSLPADDRILRPILRRVDRPALLPTPQTPLSRLRNPLARLLLTLDLEDARRLPANLVRPHPAARAFPGMVPDDAPRVSHELEIDTKTPGWHGTGLYAPAGEAVVVEIPRAAAGRGLVVRIGAHSDELWEADSWSRCPEVCRRFALDAPENPAASGFGGLLYVEVPEGCPLGVVRVRLGNAVEAPRYVLGRTTGAEWLETQRQRPAAWAELESGSIILTVPAAAIRTLDDPESLMRFWDRIADTAAELATIPPKRTRPERYVSDQQIAAGSMHAGYPIMTHLDAAGSMVELARMQSGEDLTWGLFHELGHNHQQPDWTFAGTGEVTVNLFSLYLCQTLCGIGPDEAWGGNLARSRGKLRDMLASGAKPWGGDDTRADLALRLLMYAQLQEGFGWDAYRKVFAEYRRLPADQRPRSDDEKRDQWLVRFSRTVGRNLGPFFEAWGLKTSAEARASLEHLPAWLPAGWPARE